MKLDLFKRQWLDIVFEGRHKTYGAYELRASNPKTTARAMIIGAVIFTIVIVCAFFITVRALIKQKKITR